MRSQLREDVEVSDSPDIADVVAVEKRKLKRDLNGAIRIAGFKLSTLILAGLIALAFVGLHFHFQAVDQAKQAQERQAELWQQQRQQQEISNQIRQQDAVCNALDEGGYTIEAMNQGCYEGAPAPDGP